MKPFIMKAIIKYLSVVALSSLAAVAVSCKGEDQPESEKKYEMEDIVIPMTFDTFISSSDVVIDSKDTTSLLVSTAYLDNVVKKEIVDEVTYLAIWLGPNQFPFYRQVLKSEKIASDRVRLSVAPADISCCLAEGQYNISTEVFCNPKEQPRQNGKTGSINSLYYYNSAEDEYHPVAIIPSANSGANVGENGKYDSNYDHLNSTMIEDWPSQNWTFDNTLKLSFEAKDKYFGDDDTEVKIGFASIKAAASVGVRFTLDVGVEWKKTTVAFVPIWYPSTSLEKFETIFMGGFDAEYQAVAQIQGSVEKKNEISLVTLAPVNLVFMIGPVPVLIDMSPEIVFGYKFELSGAFGLTQIGSMSVGCENGVSYSNGQWTPISNSKPFDPDFKFGLDVEGSVEGTLGLYLKIPVKIDKIAGPYISVGPEFKAKAEGMALFEIPPSDEDSYSPEFSTSVDVAVNAQVGAELKLLNWKIGTPKLEFTLFKTNLFSWPD